MDEHTDSLTQAREAYAARDWATAATRFDAVPTEQLAADDLADYADAVWWLGRIDDNLRLSAAACDAFLAGSRPVEAAGAALVLGVFHLARGDEPQGIGWIGRAGHLLEGVPECPVHGLLLHLTGVEPSLQAGQPAAAVDAARRVQDLGRRLAQPDLVALGLNGEGRALIRSGHVIDGLRLLDEAMIAVLDGELAPFMAGTLYCHTIAACHEVADVRRMTRWTDLAERWLATFPAAVAFGGLCAVHRAQLHLIHGRWDDAERTALQVVAGPRCQPDRLRRRGLVRRGRGAPAARRPERRRRLRRGARPRARPAAGSGPAAAPGWRRRGSRDVRTHGPDSRGQRFTAQGAVVRCRGRDRGCRRTTGRRVGRRLRARGDGSDLCHLRAGGDGGRCARRNAARRRPRRGGPSGAARRLPALARARRDPRRRRHLHPAGRGLQGTRRRGVRRRGGHTGRRGVRAAGRPPAGFGGARAD